MSTYTSDVFTKHINKNIKIIIECGSRDCLDAIEMLQVYKPDIIYSFECNPESIQICKQNIVNFDSIKLIEYAVGNINGPVTFYPTDMEKSLDKNIGASSMLYHRDNKIDFFQKKIEVNSIRLDKFFEDKTLDCPNILCLDLQGYEKFAIEGFGNRIKDINYIISEISHKSFYENDILYPEYINFLKESGFELIETDCYNENALFKNIYL